MRRSNTRSGKANSPSRTGRRILTRSRRVVLAVVAAVLGFLSLGGIMIVGTTAAPQTETTASTEQTSIIAPDPLGTIDGAKNPELIPDELALRMIVLAVAEPGDATEAQKERARAKLRPVGLSEEDTAAFLDLLTQFQAQAVALDKQAAEVYVRAPIPHPASTEYEFLIDLGKQKDRLTANTVAAMPAKLSQEGFEKLLTYLPEAKKGIKIFPDANLELMQKD